MAGIFCINTISEEGFSVAMTVRNNAAAMYALNQLGRNDSDLTKQLKKVSSGMRINSAADDASGYAISVRLRSLEGAYGQDIQNAQTGANLVAVAEGGIQSVVDNLRTMKEMMLNARNDTNTDADRATIQKELDKRLETITDIAAETDYNGRLLLNGDYSAPYDRVETVTVSTMVRTTTVTVGPPSVTVEVRGDGKYVLIQNNNVTDLMSNFKPYSNSSCVLAQQKNGSYVGMRGTMKCDLAYGGGMTTWSWPEEMGRPAGTQTNQIAVEADFSGMNVNGGTWPDALENAGFTIVCGACEQYINIKFDPSVASSSYEREDRSKTEFTIGVQNVTDPDDLADAIFQGIASAPYNDRKNGWYVDPDSSDNVLIDGNHEVRMAKNPNGTGYVFLKDNPRSNFPTSLTMGFISSGTIKAVMEDPPSFPVGTTTILGPTTTTVSEYIPVQKEELVHHDGNPLIIHTGAKQNQYIPVFINSMHPIALGINGVRVDDDRILDKTEPLGDPSVNKFAKLLKQVDDAIDYTLNEIVRMGAYRQRLSMTEDNLTTAQENTVSAKSTIADADMAKEMTGYTKANVLAQTAQSMVAQANQNLGGVLDLLQ